VIDVGINRITDADQLKKIFGDAPSRSVIGDAHPVEVAEAAGAYTPVPGGVGPLTIAMLMSNTVQAAEDHLRCSA
jgi:methylenetetrahydrofolate dehydrogenase (NADP+) / methenyltetrahydrofolate cyclohydrolase